MATRKRMDDLTSYHAAVPLSTSLEHYALGMRSLQSMVTIIETGRY